MAIDVSVQKRLGDFSLDVSFSSPGGIVGLLGASGCGKSKTLQSIAGIGNRIKAIYRSMTEFFSIRQRP